MHLTLESRGERTRSAIMRAFADLLFRGGFENVSIRKIVLEAGTARSTFYEHFSGKEDLLRASMAKFLIVFAQCVSEDEPPSELTRVLTHFWENRRLTDVTFSGAPRKIISLSLSEMIETRLRQFPGADLLVLPPRLAAIQIAEAQLALVESWMRGRAFARIEDIVFVLHRTSRALASSMMNEGW